MVVVLLLLSVGASLVAIWVRRNPQALSVADISSMANDVFALPEDQITLDVQVRVYLDQGRIWSTRVAGQDRVNSTNARFWKLAQVSLALAMFIVGIFLAILLKRAMLR
jgi:hypothetical protein